VEEQRERVEQWENTSPELVQAIFTTGQTPILSATL